MGGIAAIARERGHRVTGSDRNVYPPMSTQLAALGIDVIEGYHAGPARAQAGRLRGRQRHEPRQRAGRSRCSTAARVTNPGPEWLARNVLQRDRWVLGGRGHARQDDDQQPAGLDTRTRRHAARFPDRRRAARFRRQCAARHGPPFVIEADEYDTAFFDKRAKFVHYRPRTAVLNNLEHDHADIYPDVASIQRQFHLLLRTVSGNGRLLVNADGPNIWRRCSRWVAGRRSNALRADASERPTGASLRQRRQLWELRGLARERCVGTVDWDDAWPAQRRRMRWPRLSRPPRGRR